jgi:hypothetical protein
MMLEVVEKYQMTFELMIDEDGHFLNYLYEDGAGKRVLGSPTDDDWCNIRHFINLASVLRCHNANLWFLAFNFQLIF